MKNKEQVIRQNSTTSITTFLFAGAKEVSTIKSYEKTLLIYNFIDSVDWGWFFFLTKPMFSLLDIFNGYIGNMGWSIILLTLFIKTLLLPLSLQIICVNVKIEATPTGDGKNKGASWR